MMSECSPSCSGGNVNGDEHGRAAKKSSWQVNTVSACCDSNENVGVATLVARGPLVTAVSTPLATASLSTHTPTPCDVPQLPAASRALVTTMCGPSSADVLSNAADHGGPSSSLPNRTPSRNHWT